MLIYGKQVMKILFLTGREFDYQRNVFLYKLLENFGEIDVWNNKVDKFAKKSILLRTLLLTALVYSKKITNYDLIFIGFYGQFLMILLRYFISRPILFDAFISTFDTLCFDRKIFSPSSVLGRFSYWIDKQSCEWANAVLLDTPQHIDYFVNTFGLDQKKIYSIPVGCDENIFFPRQSENSIEDSFVVLSYSTYLPLHGMDVVIKAAEKLKWDNSIKFNLLGHGQEYKKVKNYVEIHNLKNVNFFAPVSINALPHFIQNSSVVLVGHFGSSEKAHRVIPGKVYQALAMQKAIIASDTTANRSLLTNGINAILVPPSDPEALAEAILKLKIERNLAKQISINGRLLFLEKCTTQANIPLMKLILEKMGF
jgi:glycosyltransferase involved in cell wall biosynthesis